MQPSYALLPATSYPKIVGGMCYAIIELPPIALKQPLVTSQSEAREARHAIPACNNTDKLSQHAVTQS